MGLARFALHRPQTRAWAMYDWANSSYVVMMTAIFPIYFASVAGANLSRDAATSRYALATTIALALVAVAAPLLGTLADFAAMKKRMLAGCMGIGVVATALMFFIERGDWILAAALLIASTVGRERQFRLLRRAPAARRARRGN